MKSKRLSAAFAVALSVIVFQPLSGQTENRNIENSSPLSQQEDDSDASQSPDNQYRTIKKMLDDELAKLEKATETSEEDRKESADATRVYNEFAGRFLKLALANPGKPAAFKSLAWIANHQCEQQQAATDLLFADFPESKEAVALIQSIQRMEDPLASITRLGLIGENEKLDSKLRAFARMGLAQRLASQVSHHKLLVDDPAKQKEFRDRLGEDYVNATLKINADETEQRLELMLEELTENFMDVHLGRTNIGEVAEKRLFARRCLAIGRVAPEISGEDVFGVEFKLSDYRGKVVLLDFWGDW